MGHTFRRVIASAATASVISAMALFRVSSASSALDPGVGNVPQGLQSNSAYAASFKGRGVTNVFVTSQKVSCYVPEVPSPFNNGPNDGYQCSPMSSFYLWRTGNYPSFRGEKGEKRCLKG